MTEYQTVDGDSVPNDVAEAFDEPEAWPDNYRTAPDSILVAQTFIGPVYEGFVDGDRKRVTERGHVDYWDSYEPVEQRRPGAVEDFEMVHEVVYRDDITHVHIDHFREHVTSVSVIGRNGKITLYSRSGVVWSHWHDQDGEVTKEMLELGLSLVDADTGIDTPDRFAKIAGGWHSSMERSETSKLVNELSAGNTPPEWHDHAEPTTDIFPFAVRNGDTRNVCSRSLSVYGSDEFADRIEAQLTDARSAPGHAGLK